MFELKASDIIGHNLGSTQLKVLNYLKDGEWVVSRQVCDDNLIGIGVLEVLAEKKYVKFSEYRLYVKRIK